MASIRISTKLLEDSPIGKMNEEQQKMITHILEDSQRLLKITDKLMNLAQVERENIQLHLRDANAGK